MAELSAEVRDLIARIDEMLAAVAAAGPAGGGTLEQMRVAALSATEQIFAAAGGVDRRAHSEVEHQVPVSDAEIIVRAYAPEADTALPGYVHIHGGAWILGSIDWPTFRAYAREVAECTPCVVVDVEYRLAPEEKFPTAVEDCYEAWEWVNAHAQQLGIDPARIVIGGDSAGGNLAAAVCLVARDRHTSKPVAQLLEVPAPDHRFSAEHSDRYPSWREFGVGFGLETEGLIAGTAFYFGDPSDALSPLASPILAKDLSGLPPAYIFTAECDPLRDLGEAFGKALSDSGVPTVVSRQAGHIHGSSFLLHPGWAPAREWRAEVVRTLQGVLSADRVAA
jgi:acetyl esterase